MPILNHTVCHGVRQSIYMDIPKIRSNNIFAMFFGICKKYGAKSHRSFLLNIAIPSQHSKIPCKTINDEVFAHFKKMSSILLFKVTIIWFLTVLLLFFVQWGIFQKSSTVFLLLNNNRAFPKYNLKIIKLFLLNI